MDNMENSYFAERQFLCPECNQAFRESVWLIIDVGERTDLLEEIKEGKSLAVSRPECKAQISDYPLLLYFPEDVPRLILATEDKGDPSAAIKEDVINLIKRLHESSGDEGIIELINKPGNWVKKEDLPQRLEGYPEKPLRERRSESHQKLIKIREEHPKAFLFSAIDAFMQAPTYSKKSRVVTMAPELLTADIDPLFEDLIKVTKEKDDERRLEVSQAHWEILKRGREIGFNEALEAHKQKLAQDPTCL